MVNKILDLVLVQSDLQNASTRSVDMTLARLFRAGENVSRDCGVASATPELRHSSPVADATERAADRNPALKRRAKVTPTLRVENEGAIQSQLALLAQRCSLP
jgi:hypothetical protein